MDADFKKIKKLTLFMKKEGVLVLKTKDFEVQLSPAAVFRSEARDGLPEAPETKEDLTPSFTPEELLMWSVPGHHPEGN